jgi:hypothetical protein
MSPTIRTNQMHPSTQTPRRTSTMRLAAFVTSLTASTLAVLPLNLAPASAHERSRP